MRTRRPRFSKSRPIAAAVSPFPRELTTPPVTKMCLVIKRMLKRGVLTAAGIPSPTIDKSSIIFRRVDSNRRALDQADLNDSPRFECAQLLQFFQSLQPAHRQARELHQRSEEHTS